MTQRGFFTIAQGAEYQRLAYALALSLKCSQPDGYNKLSIGVTSDERAQVPARYCEVFDQVVEIPWRDAAQHSTWKLENEWKAIHMTPYDETVKLDADMIFPEDISSWWHHCSQSQGVFATAPRTYRDHIITSDACRKTFTDSNLPNIYTAFFFFKKTQANFELFALAEDIFNNWQRYFYEFLAPESRPDHVSTDVVFALAAKILDYVSLDVSGNTQVPTFVHMKTELQNWPQGSLTNNDWTRMIPTYFSHDCKLKIGNFRQTLPFHYQVKTFITDRMISLMEKKLGI